VLRKYARHLSVSKEVLEVVRQPHLPVSLRGRIGILKPLLISLKKMEQEGCQGEGGCPFLFVGYEKK
jgi:hypothetical protein